MTARIDGDEVKQSYWQLIFLQSRVNGCFYNAEDLPVANWRWPQNTWFQERLSRSLSDLRAPRGAVLKIDLPFGEALC